MDDEKVYNTSGLFLLANTEVAVDAYLTGFEVHARTTGKINIQVTLVEPTVVREKKQTDSMI